MTTQLTTQLAQRLARPLPDSAVRAAMAPSLSYGRHFVPPDARARAAAVLALVYPSEGEWTVPLTVRPDTMVTHAGQISLPGGLVEPGESNREAALRELAEELGVGADDVRIVGELSPLYVFVSNFLVTPCVAVARRRPEMHPSADEVAAVLEVPLAHLIDARNRGRHVHRHGPLEFSVPHIAWGEHRIWGATGIILAELAAVAADALAAASPP